MFRNISINLLVVLSFSFSQEFYDVEERTRNGHPKKVVKYDTTGLYLQVKKIYWFYDNGQKEEEATLNYGLRNGLSTRWYENEQKELEGTFKDGYKDGLWNEWYENGQKEFEGTWKDGKKDGLITEWYENGQKKLEGTYKDGKPMVGTQWKEDGSVWD